MEIVGTDAYMEGHMTVVLINRVKSVEMNLIKFRKFQSAEHTAIHWPRAAMKKSPKKKWKMEKIQKCKGDKRPE